MSEEAQVAARMAVVVEERVVVVAVAVAAAAAEQVNSTVERTAARMPAFRTRA